MKKYILFIALSVLGIFFAVSANANASVPAVYINGEIVSTSEGFYMSDSTLYVRSDVIADLFDATLVTDTGGIVYTFSNQLRVVTYDSSTGSLNITDRNSFLYEVYEKQFPSCTIEDSVYIPIRMICVGFGFDVVYIGDDFSVRISTFRDCVGIFNSDGTAVAYRGGKYGLVNRNGDILLRFAFDDISNYDNPSLFKVTYNHRCGLATGSGHLITNIAYNEIRYETPGSIYLRQGDKWGMCDISGTLIVPVKYDDVSYYANLIAMVKLGTKWNVLDCKNGELSQRNYDMVYKLTTGVQTDNSMIKGYYVQKGDKWGYIDSFGNVVIELKYEALDKFDELGRARVIYNGKFGVVDCGGAVIIPPAYDYLDAFGETDITVAQIGDKYGVINDKFEVVVPFKYDYIYSFNNNPATVALIDGKYGIISSSGEQLTEFEYTHMEEFRNGYALAFKDGYGYLNLSGEEVIEPVHSDVKQGTALSIFLKKDSSWALFTPDGQNLTGFIYASAGVFSNGLSAVSVDTASGRLYGYVNDSGDVVIPFIYTAALDFKYGKAIVTKGKYSGIIDIEGNTVIPFVYTGFNSSYDYNVIAAADENSKWGLISFRNEKLCAFEYDYIFEFEDGYAYTIKNHLYGMIDTYGNTVVQPSYKTQKAAYEKLCDITE